MWKSLGKIWLLFVVVQSKQLPQFLKDLRCSMTKNFEACYIESASKAIPLLANGLPEFDIPKLNPYQFSFLETISTPELSVNLTNTKIYGLENLRPVKVEQSEDTNIYVITFTNRNITIIGEYSADGKVGLLPMKGTGPFSIYLENCMFKVIEPVQTVVKDDDEYLVSRNFKLEQNFQKIVFNFENLFDGNKELGNVVNRFLNENSSMVLEEFGGAIVEHVKSLIKKILESFSENVPAKDMYLP